MAGRVNPLRPVFHTIKRRADDYCALPAFNELVLSLFKPWNFKLAFRLPA